jgi:hypothetical protein
MFTERTVKVESQLFTNIAVEQPCLRVNSMDSRSAYDTSQIARGL